MKTEVIHDIEDLLRNTFRETDEVLLHQLIWTIDAKHHLIPTPDELNKAVESLNGITIARNKGSIVLRFVEGEKSDYFVADVIKEAMIEYRKTLE